MKICIDGIGISLLKGTGLYSYTYDILNNLFEMYPQPTYEIICDKAVKMDKWEKNKRIAWLNLHLNRKEDSPEQLLQHIRSEKITLFHSLNNGFSIPYTKNSEDQCKYVSTVHDVIAISKGELVDEKYRNKFKQVFPMALENSDKIVAVSEFIKNDILKHYDIQENKIEVIYPGCGQQFRPLDYKLCTDFLREAYHIEGDIILYSGSLHVRKNLHRLLYILKDISKFNNNVKLVVVGKNNDKRFGYYKRMKELGSELNLEDRIYFTGIVEYEYMPYFYNAAKCIVNLSDYEGFPMSSVEALCCGTPVICSNSPSFKETIKNEGIFVYADNENQIKEVILEVMNDSSYKEEAMNNSKSVIKRYSWQKSVEKYVRLYESLIV